MIFSIFIFGVLSLSSLVVSADYRYTGSLASRAAAVVSARNVENVPTRKRDSWTKAMGPKLVVSGAYPKDLTTRQLSLGNGGISIGGPNGIQLGGGPRKGQGQSAEGTTTNQTAAGIAALEGAKNITADGLTIGGLTLGGTGGGIVLNGDKGQGQPDAQPAVAQPADNSDAAVSGNGQQEIKSGEQTAALAEGPSTPATDEPTKPGNSAALRESEQFDGQAGITTDSNGNAVNLGGDLGITKGSDGSTSVGGESGINIIPRAMEAPAAVAAPAPVKTLQTPKVPDLPILPTGPQNAPAPLPVKSLPPQPNAAPSAPPPPAVATVPALPLTAPTAPAPLAAQSIPALPNAAPIAPSVPLPLPIPSRPTPPIGLAPGQREGPAPPISQAPATEIPDFIPGTLPTSSG